MTEMELIFLGEKKEDYTSTSTLQITDSICLACYGATCMFEIVVLVKYMFPLRIKDPYILMFHFLLLLLIVSAIVETTARMIYHDPGYITNPNDVKLSFGTKTQHISNLAYILLGLVISTMMF